MTNKKLFGGDGQKEYSDRVFSGLDLKRASISSRIFNACVFRNCDLTGAVLRFSKFRECVFESCNLSLVTPCASRFEGVSFRDSKLSGMNWTEADWPKLRLFASPEFIRCILNDCNFLGAPLEGCVIKNCLAKGADFREADLSGADFSGTDLSESLFGGTNLSGTDLSGARNYSIDIKNNLVKGAKFSLPEAMSLLYRLEIEIV